MREEENKIRRKEKNKGKGERISGEWKIRRGDKEKEKGVRKRKEGEGRRIKEAGRKI